jgi:competence protein ComEC
VAGTVAFVDVGQGDCTVALDAGSRHALVIDCPVGGVPNLYNQLDVLGAAAVDLLIATHSDWDHLGGLVAIANQYAVPEVRVNTDVIVDPSPGSRTRLKAAMLALAGLADMGTAVLPAYRGDLGSLGAISWRVLSPTHDQLLAAMGRDRPNHSSTVITLEIGGVRFLVSGDADAQAWNRMLDRGIDVRADVLRVPHHGADMGSARSSTLDRVLDAVAASYFIVSVGTLNSYRHPRAETISKLRQRCPPARIMCTEVTPLCTSIVGISGAGATGAACAGTIVFTVSGSQNAPSPSGKDHDLVVDSWHHPACRHVSIGSPQN